MKRSTRWLTGAITAAAVIAAACGDNGSDEQTSRTTPAPSAVVGAAAASAAPATAATSMTKAADLRTTLNGLLSEHVALAASATAGALGGRQAQFDGAAAALDANSVELSKAVGSVYGAQAEQAFLPLWRKHIGFVVDYTQGVAAKDQAKQDKAVADLTQYSQDAGAFFAAAKKAPESSAYWVRSAIALSCFGWSLAAVAWVYSTKKPMCLRQSGRKACSAGAP